MEGLWAEKRSEKRSYFEVSDTGNILEAKLNGKKHQFKILDTGLGGMGMLVMEGQAEVLKNLKLGVQLEMTYIKPNASLLMNFEIRHISIIKTGAFKGHYKVGLSMSLNPEK